MVDSFCRWAQKLEQRFNEPTDTGRCNRKERKQKGLKRQGLKFKGITEKGKSKLIDKDMKKKKESVSDWSTSLPPHSTKVRKLNGAKKIRRKQGHSGKKEK